MSAPIITVLEPTFSPNDLRIAYNANLASLRSNTVWLDPASTQSGIFNVTAGLLSSYLSIGASPASAGAVRLENTAEIRWAYAGSDTYRIRSNATGWDLSYWWSGAWHPVINTLAGILQLPGPVSLSTYMVMAEISEPSSPASGYGALFTSGGKVYFKDSSGNTYDLTAGAAAILFSRGAGLPDPASVPEGAIRWDETELMLNINVNGAWRQI